LPPAEHRDSGLFERGVVGYRSSIVRRDLTEHDEAVREIEATEDRSDDRHDDVAGQAGGDGAECCSDDDGNRKVEYVAASDEVPEFLQHEDSPLASRSGA
jgi:hypothetical protein